MFKKSKKFFCCLAVATSLLASSAIVYAQSVNFTICTERNHTHDVAKKNASKNGNDYDNYAYFKVTSAYGTGSMNLWSQNLQNSWIQSGSANFHSSELNVRKIKEYNVSHAPSNELYQLNAQYGNSPGGQPVGFSGTFTP